MCGLDYYWGCSTLPAWLCNVYGIVLHTKRFRYVTTRITSCIGYILSGPKFEWITCDITKYTQVQEALKGCDVVLHIASVIPGAFKDDKATMYEVNTTGAMNITDACLENDVGELVYVSSISVVGPNDRREPAKNVTEDAPYHCGRRTFYGKTKKIAEDYVLDANGKLCPNGKEFVTCALRPGPIYGENFRAFETISKAARGKVIYSITSKEARCTSIYVGNLASAVILAGKQLRSRKEVTGGQAYFITDDTKPTQVFQMLGRMMSPLGYTVSRQPMLPYPLNFIIYTLLYWINYLLRYVGLSKTSIAHPEELWRWDVVFTHSGQKFAEHFSYKPLFSESESLKLVHRYVLQLHEINFKNPIYDYQYTQE